MTRSIYHRLREQLDQYSVGYPATPSGVEIRILQRLFSEEEAALFLDLSMMLETPAAVAQRTGRSLHATARMLEQMAAKGVLFRKRDGEKVEYAAVAFVIGAYEFQVKNMDSELAQMMETYFKEGFLKFSPDKNIFPLRTIPVQRSLAVTHAVAPHAQARAIIKTKQVIAVADCICRTQQRFIGKGCDKPVEVCLSFGPHADYYVDNRIGRYISQDEALAVVDAAEQAGLVSQPANMINPGGICNCCWDCCGVLRTVARTAQPARAMSNDFRAAVDAQACVACGNCLERCRLEAVTIQAEAAVVNNDRCIGCGLCVAACPEGAIEMVLKPQSERVKPPPSGRKLMTRTAKVRGTSLVPFSMMPALSGTGAPKEESE